MPLHMNFGYLFSILIGKSEATADHTANGLTRAAADQFIQAANAFRMQKQSTSFSAPFCSRPILRLSLDREAGQCFERAASIQSTKLSEPDDMANTLTEAFKVCMQLKGHQAYSLTGFFKFRSIGKSHPRMPHGSFRLPSHIIHRKETFAVQQHTSKTSLKSTKSR
jgi:hypothetical protein